MERLNPFAFPSETEFRFVLLVVSVLGSSLLLYAAIYEALPPTRSYKQAEYARCTRLADPTDLSGTYAERAARVLAHGECTASADRLQAGWMLGGLALVIGIAAVIYWSNPFRKLRRDRLLDLQSSAPDVTQCVTAMCRESGLPSDPIFVANPLNATRTGLVFGHLGQKYVALTGGLLKQFYADPPAFRAVVFHELAHIRNADVDRTYFTVALWQAFVVAALVPFALSQIVASAQPDDLFGLAWRIVPLAVLVYLTRNAVLRAREIFADVRASIWDGPSGALRRTLEALPKPGSGVWRRVWDLHPDPAERRRAVDDTRPLLAMSGWDALATGIAAGIALPNVIVLLGLLVPMPIAIVRPLGAALLVAPLAVGIVGLGVWRASFAALVARRPMRGAGRLGVALAVGLVLGQELSLAGVEFARGAGPVAGIHPGLLDGLWCGVLVCVLGVFFRWIAAGASTWLEVAADDPSPGRAYRIGLGIAGALLAAWLGVLFFVYLAVRTGGNAVAWSDIEAPLATDPTSPLVADPSSSLPMVGAATAILVGLNILVLVSLIAVWAYPLAAWFWRGRMASPIFAGWAFLDTQPPAVRVPIEAPLLPGRALAVGTAAGLAGTVIVLLGPLAWAWTAFEQMLVAVLAQVVVGAVVGAWVPRLGGLHGLFAAFVAACMMAAGVVATFGPMSQPWDVLLLLASTILVGGAVLALPAAASAAALASRVRRS